MSKRVRRRRDQAGGSQQAASVASVTVCRGCCCGTVRAQPGTDHAAQLALLRKELAGVAEVRVSGCLDACERSNVMVVSPDEAGRSAGARPVWLGEVLDDRTTRDVVAWVTAGGPGNCEPHGMLDLHEFAPSRRVRAAGEAPRR